MMLKRACRRLAHLVCTILLSSRNASLVLPTAFPVPIKRPVPLARVPSRLLVASAPATASETLNSTASSVLTWTTPTTTGLPAWHAPITAKTVILQAEAATLVRLALSLQMMGHADVMSDGTYLEDFALRRLLHVQAVSTMTERTIVYHVAQDARPARLTLELARHALILHTLFPAKPVLIARIKSDRSTRPRNVLVLPILIRGWFHPSLHHQPLSTGETGTL